MNTKLIFMPYPLFILFNFGPKDFLAISCRHRYCFVVFIILNMAHIPMDHRPQDKDLCSATSTKNEVMNYLRLENISISLLFLKSCHILASFFQHFIQERNMTRKTPNNPTCEVSAKFLYYPLHFFIAD